jgi:D-amino-acid dehydrogenase
MKHVTVIGGGIIGLSSAYYLQKAGYQVRILEKKSIGEACSLGNAGYISPSHFIPLAAPGMIWMGIKWMFNSESPFYIKPRFDLKLLRWSWLFYRSANNKTVERSVPILNSMLQESQALFIEISKAEGFAFEYDETGLLLVCTSEETFKHEQELIPKAKALGIDAYVVDLKTAEPNFPMEAAGAVLYPRDAVIDPKKFTSQLADYLKKNGAEILENCEVTDFNKEAKKITSIKTTKGNFDVSTLLVTAGSWSPLLIEKTGLSLPMQAGKGYSMTIANPKVKPKHSIIYVEGRIALTPFKNSFRVAGTMEVADINEDINPSRIAGIKKSLKKMAPAYDQTELNQTETWCGMRPVTPDGMPYIGALSTLDNTYVNFGHAMLGISLGPISGKLIAEKISCEKQSIDISILNPMRFN